MRFKMTLFSQDTVVPEKIVQSSSRQLLIKGLFETISECDFAIRISKQHPYVADIGTINNSPHPWNYLHLMSVWGEGGWEQNCGCI